MGNVKANQERTFDLQGGEGTPRLSIQHLNGDIHIATWDRPQISVRIDDDDVDIEDVFQMRQQDGEVQIGLEWDHERIRGQRRAVAHELEDAVRAGDFAALGAHIGAWVGRIPGPRPDVDVAIKVPALCDVTVRTVTGDVEIEGVTGNLYIESASGDVSLAGVRGNLIGKSASGEFEVDGFAGRLGLRTASGDVSVRGGELPAVSIGTVSGDIELSGLLVQDGEYTIQTTSGDTALALPADTRCSVKIRTVSGDVDCDLPYQRTRESRRHMRLDVNGGGPVIEFGSISGDLEITKLSGAPAPATAPPEGAPTQRLRREDSPAASGTGETFRVAGDVPTTRVAAAEQTPGAPRQSAEMAILEAIERGELSVEDGLARLAELK